MFTGLVECVGVLQDITGVSPKRLEVSSSIPAEEVNIGDSIAIDGTCLTVVEKAERAHGSLLHFEAATETLQVTTLGSLRAGARVNLERALQVGARLGGHIVSGHVDGIGEVLECRQDGSALYIKVEAPAVVARLTAKRGSITMAGVSLTVTDVDERAFEVGLIPHTLEMTTLGKLAVGDRVNLEADVIARYVERLIATRDAPWAAGLTE